MKKWIILLLLTAFLVIPVSAMEFTAPIAPQEALPYMPPEEETFAQGLWYIIKTAVQKLRPELSNAGGICYRLVAVVLLLSIVSSLSSNMNSVIRLAGGVVLGLMMLDSASSMIQLGAQTVTQLGEYTKLLLPVMTAALAAQGGVTSSAALYTGTVMFNTLLTSVISRLIIPAVYIYLCLCVACCCLDQDMLQKVRNTVKGATVWCLKTVLYVFTGYISITGVVSGVVDSSALKATKLTISGAVPVVGGILSDASETILVSAGVMKSAAGVYGIFAALAICIGPFLQIGILYVLLKLAGSVCNMIGYKPAAELVDGFSGGMGIVLAMTGTVCVLLLISLVCFMKGMGI